MSVYIFCLFICFDVRWVVVGGVWIGVWLCALFVGWMIASVVNGDQCCTAFSLGGSIRNMIGVTVKYAWQYHLIKFMESVLGMTMIFIFLYSSFECEICVSQEQRMIYRDDNDRIALLVVIGWLSSVAQFALYVTMKTFHIIEIEQMK